ncbi:MAG: hypothetical protein AAB516_00955 [Patescibacteria group bacterium]
MNPKIFRAYDIRGKYPLEINEEVVEKISRFLGRYFINPKPKTPARGEARQRRQNPKPKIVIGHDARLSSSSLYKIVLKSLKASARGGSALGGKNLKALPAGRQVKTIPVGMTTTPMFYFLVNKLNADGGIMITASHNPKNYNGLKVVGRNAVPISGKEILKLI